MLKFAYTSCNCLNIKIYCEMQLCSIINQHVNNTFDTQNDAANTEIIKNKINDELALEEAILTAAGPVEACDISELPTGYISVWDTTSFWSLSAFSPENLKTVLLCRKFLKH